MPVADSGNVLSEHRRPDANIPQICGTNKRIVVNLKEQHIYAYESRQLVYDARLSSGLPDTPTVEGEFAIYAKYKMQTMRGPDYDRPLVPYVLYFYESYSLHGTNWHNQFGRPMSYGCINLAVEDAHWFYDWADLGTPVAIQ